MAVSFIKSSGNIISEDFCKILAEDYESSYVKNASFNAKKIEEDIAVTFDLLRERWEEIRLDIIDKKFDTTHLRNRWLIRVFEYLGYDQKYNKSFVKSDAGIEFQLSHIGWDSPEAPIIHMVGLEQDLDLKDTSNRTHPNKSPHDLLQNFLNVDNHKWGILSNGHKIRILRDFHHSITKGYLEFDLEGIFETASLSDFRVMFILLHRTRFENQYEQDSSEDKCILETIYEKSQETGIEVGNKLRDQVRNAIESLGNGFIQNIDTENLETDYPKHLYEEILNIIYRILFLLFAEQKGWLPIKNEVYAKTYSINALRELSERAELINDEHDDLWAGLKITFKLVSKGYTFTDGDHVNAFGGQLFSEKKINTSYQYRLKNKFLLTAIKELSYFEQDKVKHKINYATLAIEALGSVYESLLDYEPRINKEEEQINGKLYPKGAFILDDRSTERKTTGSYYTDSRLVAQLIDSALVPVIENAINEKESQKEMEEAILDLNVCDMAMGSAAFLVAALNKMGEELAKIRKGEEELPTEEQLREAKRDVLQNCIYGVDINPMAVELAKFSLWITASMPNFPLSFLDHKLKCGNSLIGATSELIKKGIPVEAYNPVTLDEPEICRQLKEKVKKELKQIENEVNEPNNLYKSYADERRKEQLEAKRKKIYDSEQEDVDVIEELEEEYHKLIEEEKKYKDWLLANAWTSAFFINKENSELSIYPTNYTLIAINENELILSEIINAINEIADRFKFFHWHLEFPFVFDKGGFDCILGNPPWEVWELKEKEFFSNLDRNIIEAKSGAERKRLILNLQSSNKELFNKYELEKNKSDNIGKFFNHSGNYYLTAHGKLNLYSLFADRTFKNISKKGRIGLILPSGIATDDNTKFFFQEIINEKRLISLCDFENKQRLFHNVHLSYKFCLLTLSGFRSKSEIDFCFFLTNPQQLLDRSRHFTLTEEELSSLNPNTLNCPVFRSNKDAVIVKRTYKSHNVLLNEKTNINDWKIDLKVMLNMTTASNLFIKQDTLYKAGARLISNRFYHNEKIFYPLYEGKMISLFDHRSASVVITDNVVRSGQGQLTEDSLKKDLDYEPIPRFWVDESNFSVNENWNHNWLFVYKKVTSPTNERTFIGTIIPKSAVADSLLLIHPQEIERATCLFANISTIVFDYIVRQKIGGVNLTFNYVKQLPVLKPSDYNAELFEFINSRYIKLCYTSNSLKDFARDFGYNNDPYMWQDIERFNTQCQLDALFGRLYKLNSEEFSYILDTFNIINRKDIARFGFARTKDTILKYFEEYKI